MDGLIRPYNLASQVPSENLDFYFNYCFNSYHYYNERNYRSYRRNRKPRCQFRRDACRLLSDSRIRLGYKRSCRNGFL